MISFSTFGVCGFAVREGRERTLGNLAWMAFFKSPTVTWDGCLAGNSTETVGLEEYLTVTVTMLHEYQGREVGAL